MKKTTWFLVLSALTFACAPNETGKLAARGAGERIDAPLGRLDATEAIASACGSPELADPSLPRAPYVQSVSATRASVLWTSTGAPEQLELWRPDGESSIVEGTDEPTAMLTDATQRAARLEQLEPGTLHCYRLLRAGEVVFGPTGFRTAPADDSAPVDVLVLGDSGSGSADQWAARAQMDTVPIDLMIHVGDVAYAEGTMDQFETNVFDVYEGLFESFPFFPSIGNHDDSTAAAAPYREVFELPQNGGPADELERRYSFDWGPIHFVALDTNRLRAEQAEWLERDLAATDRPWKVVFGHHPPYSSGWHGSTGAFRELFQETLERHGVQLVLSGHDHDYERTIEMGGVTYVVTGAAGASTRPVGKSEWTVYAEDVVHFVSLHVEGPTLRGYAIDAMGTVFDSFALTR